MEETENHYWSNLAKKAWDNYEKVLGLTLLITYAFGYSYLKFFYRSFNINIEHYIDVSDMLFLTVNTLLNLLLAFVGYQILILFAGAMIIRLIRIFKKNTTEGDSYIKRIFLGAAYVNAFLFILFIVCPHLIEDWIDAHIVYSLICPSAVFHYCIITVEKFTEPNEKLEGWLLALFIASSFIGFTLSGYEKGKQLKHGRSTKKLEFITDSKPYSTSDKDTKYIGETNSYIFLYSTADRKSLIFNKENLSDYKVLDYGKAAD